MATPTPGPFTFGGQLDRGSYWRYIGLLMGIRFGAAILVAFNPNWAGMLKGLDFILLFVAAVLGRRLRDIGWPAWLGWVGVLLASFVIPIVAAIALSGRDHQGGEASLGGIPAIAGWLSTASLLILIVAVGIPKGKASEEKVGDVFV